jgi:hypothetical protein
MKTINLAEKNGIRHRNGTFRCPLSVRQSHSFFRKKPRLGLNKSIGKVPIELTVAWQRQGSELRDLKVFKANIWVLEINNTRRFSSTATHSYATLHIRNLGSDIPLEWRTYIEEPNSCILNEEPRPGEQVMTLYHRMMSFFYTQIILARNTSSTTSIHVGEKYSLYFLFTYEGSNHAFIITPSETPRFYEDEIYYRNIDGVFLFFNTGEEPEMTIRLASTGQHNTSHSVDATEIRFRIRINSWDSIELLK